ncbi:MULTISPECIES: hypothetical protein [unclassified Pseudomonas]|jgi:hypothetical protein|uniref:hypothetical protein n=1 Tax=Pseudomonas TaxID=286 RepID=UPI000A1EC541|nr:MULTISPECIES: hypothetical protein [unclassified Pseudomonas]MCH4897459.1 hypothetical protein [Pseudomonas sp. B707]PNB47792.1 hypothetical protein C1X29_21655 [Pseudomonas sp. GW456-12-10-14-LB2]TEA59298.1 hypothetical protein EIY71_23710 [Pseudomonas sp. CH235]
MAISRVTETTDKTALVQAEVYRWYNLFFPWSRGVASQSEEAIKPLYDALANDFRVVLTDGQIMDRENYWERLWGLHGKRAGSPESHIINLSITPLPGDCFLTVFDLVKNGITKKKVDSALMRLDPDSPSGISWIYVHESEHETSFA